MRLVAIILSGVFCLAMVPLQAAAQTENQSDDTQTKSGSTTASDGDQDRPQDKAQPSKNAGSDPDPAAQTKSAQTKTAQTESTQTKSDQATTTASTAAGSTDDAPKESFELTFDDLKFEMEKGSKFDRSLLTDKINSYHNNVITVRGYIRPSFSQSGLKKFIFVRDNKECCFGPGAALYDCILVRLSKGSTTDFTVRPVTIKGTFSLKEYEGPDGKVWSIYRMNDTEMK